MIKITNSLCAKLAHNREKLHESRNALSEDNHHISGKERKTLQTCKKLESILSKRKDHSEHLKSKLNANRAQIDYLPQITASERNIHSLRSFISSKNSNFKEKTFTQMGRTHKHQATSSRAIAKPYGIHGTIIDCSQIGECEYHGECEYQMTIDNGISKQYLIANHNTGNKTLNFRHTVSGGGESVETSIKVKVTLSDPNSPVEDALESIKNHTITSSTNKSNADIKITVDPKSPLSNANTITLIADMGELHFIGDNGEVVRVVTNAGDADRMRGKFIISNEKLENIRRAKILTELSSIVVKLEDAIQEGEVQSLDEVQSLPSTPRGEKHSREGHGIEISEPSLTPSKEMQILENDEANVKAEMRKDKKHMLRQKLSEGKIWHGAGLHINIPKGTVINGPLTFESDSDISFNLGNNTCANDKQVCFADSDINNFIDRLEAINQELEDEFQDEIIFYDIDSREYQEHLNVSEQQNENKDDRSSVFYYNAQQAVVDKCGRGIELSVSDIIHENQIIEKLINMLIQM